MEFADRLCDAVDRKQTCLCVGFDPHLALLPPHLLNSAHDSKDAVANAVETFCMNVLDAIGDLVPAIKPQFAFFERLGSQGLLVLARLCQSARDRGLIVIGDAKRGDIGSTAEAYAEAYVAGEVLKHPDSEFTVDAITLNPYMGFEAIKPFISSTRSTGVFILVKTSNPSGAQVQDIQTRNGTVAECVADLVASWGAERIAGCGYSDIGAVVGAPYPDTAVALRRRMPNTLFLVPGYGFQGAGARDAMVTFDRHGHGGIVNSSRAVLFAWQKGTHSQLGEMRYVEAARAATLDAIADLRNGLAAVHS